MDLETAADIVINLVAAVIGWLVVQAVLTPRLRWSPHLSKRSVGDGRYTYRVKVKNSSWFRPVTDIRIRTTIWGGGIDPSRPHTRIGVRVGTAPSDKQVLKPRRHMIVTFVVTELDARTTAHLKEWGHDAAARNDRTLEELFSLCAGTYLVIQVLCSDGWTGGTHCRESPHYTRLDMAPRAFRVEKGLDRHLYRAVNGRRRSALTRKITSWLHPELRLAEPTWNEPDRPESTEKLHLSGASRYELPGQ